MSADTPDVTLAHFRHDLRTPVNAILGYSELLLDDADSGFLPADVVTGLTDLRDLGQHLLAVITGFQPTPGAADLAAVFALARTALAPTASQVTERATRLAGRAAAEGLPSAAQDLTRIADAGDALTAVLNRTAPTAPDPRKTGPVADAPAPAGGGRNWAAVGGEVLVVDDDPGNRHLFARGLQKQGHTATLAEDGPAALALLAEREFDVVLLDLLMPGMSGYEVLTRIKKDPARRHIPVIIVSALDRLEGVVGCLEAGAEDFLPKPCDAALLKARVGACLEKKRLRDMELEYLRQVEVVTAAALALEAGTYDPTHLSEAAGRADALGALARVFDHMAAEVQAREERLKREVIQLRVEIDETRKAREVAEVVETDYFRDLQQKAAALRARRG